MWDLLIAAGIVVPLVLGALWLMLRGIAAADAKEAGELIARLDCPHCHEHALQWRGVVWGEDILFDDHEDSFSGFVLCCTHCNGESQFTRGGELYHPAELD